MTCTVVFEQPITCFEKNVLDPWLVSWYKPRILEWDVSFHDAQVLDNPQCSCTGMKNVFYLVQRRSELTYGGCNGLDGQECLSVWTMLKFEEKCRLRLLHFERYSLVGFQ